jgi:hypothetical protein
MFKYLSGKEYNRDNIAFCLIQSFLYQAKYTIIMVFQQQSNFHVWQCLLVEAQNSRTGRCPIF